MIVSKTSTKEYMETNIGPSHKLIPLHILNSNKHSTNLNPTLLNKAITSAVCLLPSISLLAFINESSPQQSLSNTHKTLAKFPTTITCANATQNSAPKNPRTTQNPNPLEHIPNTKNSFGSVAKQATRAPNRTSTITHSQKLVWVSLTQAAPLLRISLLLSSWILLYASDTAWIVAALPRRENVTDDGMQMIMWRMVFESSWWRGRYWFRPSK